MSYSIIMRLNKLYQFFLSTITLINDSLIERYSYFLTNEVLISVVRLNHLNGSND